MKRFTRILAFFLAAGMAVSLTGCGKPAEKAPSGSDGYRQDSAALTFQGTWNYDREKSVCWQTGVPFTAAGAQEQETLTVYIPSTYMNVAEQHSGSCRATPNEKGEAGSYTAETAPIAFFAETQEKEARYDGADQNDGSIEKYLESGLIVVRVGGSEERARSAPWGAAALKAAVRWYRFNSDILPGDTSRIFVCGAGDGGNLAAVVGASGDSELYTPYLEALGAAMLGKSGEPLSDAVCGAACWSPVTGLDAADAAYEWNMGQYDKAGTRADGTWTAALSADLAADYANYVNQIGFKDEQGNTLRLIKSAKGVYNAGSYYRYLLTEVGDALTAFLRETPFPYTPADTYGAARTATGTPFVQPTPSGSAPTYATPKDYVDALNADMKWIDYNTATKQAKIVSMEAFVQHCKNASADVCAFDDLKRGNTGNALFGTEADEKLHFDDMLSALLQKNEAKYRTYPDWNDTLVDDFAADLKRTDAVGSTVLHRLDLYEPLYWLSGHYAGCGRAKTAGYWRIRAAAGQSTVPLTAEINLTLALRQTNTVKDVDFAEVWQQSGTMAERSGDPAANLAAWISRCVEDLEN